MTGSRSDEIFFSKLVVASSIFTFKESMFCCRETAHAGILVSCEDTEDDRVDGFVG